VKRQMIRIEGHNIEVLSMNTIIVGSGAAGLNAADRLFSLGQQDIAILTEGMNMGTSRNTGSDKQTYYKLSMSGNGADSVEDMARTLFDGGAMHGDIALVDAALSSRCFSRLLDIGVPFPHNRFGEYTGYQTDHDTRLRATSAGPLTSRFMTEQLEKEVKMKKIPILDKYLTVAILTDEDEPSSITMKDKSQKAVGMIAINMASLDNESYGLTLINCTNIIYATGGPAGMYHHSVYPESQTGSTGIALEAGAKGVNLTESQYGIASTAFRWNLSGTYQQVLPRYISTNDRGEDEKEFLTDGFSSAGMMLDAIFLKGYQWPFDPKKMNNSGSSNIDMFVWQETQRGRRVFLDYTQNPASACQSDANEMNFGLLGEEAHAYLLRSDALFGKPIDRLRKMNSPAVELFLSHGIDLSKDYLEIAVCAQHNNGGLVGDIWCESNLRHFFPVGEVNGSFGIHRPGGSALNATQTGSLRAAQAIHSRYSGSPLVTDEFLEMAHAKVKSSFMLLDTLMGKCDLICGMENKETHSLKAQNKERRSVEEHRNVIGKRMSACGAQVRPVSKLQTALSEAVSELSDFNDSIRVSCCYEIPEALRLRDILITQYVYLKSIQEYASHGGGSRGSYLICSDDVDMNFYDENLAMRDEVCEVSYLADPKMECRFVWKPVRPIPDRNDWYEEIWKKYRSGEVFTKENEEK